MTFSPANLQLIGNELAIVWSDGQESYLPLEKLRRACPCAVCCGEPDALGRVAKPTVAYTSQSFLLQSWQIVGGYAWQPKWGDGHDSGLYSFRYLRHLGAQDKNSETIKDH